MLDAFISSPGMLKVQGLHFEQRSYFQMRWNLNILAKYFLRLFQAILTLSLLKAPWETQTLAVDQRLQNCWLKVYYGVYPYQICLI